MSGTKFPSVNTPQFRTLLLRRLKNLFPSCTARIQYPPRGVAFQLFDGEGHPRSALVNIYRGHSPLTKQELLRNLRNGGEPAAGFPVEMTNS